MRIELNISIIVGASIMATGLDKLKRLKNTNNPFVYKRAQYVDLLINSEEIFGYTR